MQRFLLVLITVLCASPLAGCTAYRAVPVTDSLPDSRSSDLASWDVGVGDNVRVTTVAGWTVIGRIVSVESDE
ncbi:MAG: hypothetical protein KOO60_09990, partial [Gemmatimonadales bacterium]|nr:hypothetical protein [Gemmatimonadales bacterium]